MDAWKNDDTQFKQVGMRISYGPRFVPEISGTSSQPSFNGMTFSELKTRKRELKQQLRQYDMKFFEQHGRMPVKLDKVPIRQLYKNYKSINNCISARGRDGPPITPVIPKATLSSKSSQDLHGLKTEKQTLHQMLRSFENDFYNLHSRQVSSYADIRPCASQYRRYKEIKKQISGLQES